MKHPLKRLLRLRLLVEESSRLELESQAALAAKIDLERQREARMAREGRALAVASICEERSTADQTAQRSAGWGAAESASQREEKLGTLAQAVERRVVESREDFLERRKERRQVENVLEAAGERARYEQERRVQRELDDWFGMKQSREGRSTGKS
ncbi:MAG TPA: hypothetical protein VME86_06475 [Acidobacteriaceae bacterium]|nr:hypothetical protein [Acidobacteriaceae bacterium]